VGVRGTRHHHRSRRPAAGWSPAADGRRSRRMVRRQGPRRLQTIGRNTMRIHLINPSDVSFGLAVITPRWLFVLAAATPERFGTPILVDETLERLDPSTLSPGDIAGI